MELKRDAGNPEDASSVISNTFYYGYDQTKTNQFQPTTEIVKGISDIISDKVCENDPKFVNYPLTTATAKATYDKLGLSLAGWFSHTYKGKN